MQEAGAGEQVAWAQRPVILASGPTSLALSLHFFDSPSIFQMACLFGHTFFASTPSISADLLEAVCCGL